MITRCTRAIRRAVAVHSQWCSTWALRISAADGNLAEVLQEIDKDWAELEAVDEHGNTPLLLAVMRNQIATVKALITRGADLTALNHEGHSAVDLCHHSSSLSKLLHEAVRHSSAKNEGGGFRGNAD